jgi:hypothetical protein
MNFSFHHYRFHLEPKAPLQMPACLRATHRQAYSKGSTRRFTPRGNVIRGGFGSTFRLSAARLPERGQVSAQAERIVCHGHRHQA